MHPREWEVRKREEAPNIRLSLSSSKSIKISVASLEFEFERESFLVDSFSI